MPGIHDIDDDAFESADTGSHPMSFQWWHEIAEASDRQKQIVKSGSYINYVLWKSVSIDKQIVQQFHYKNTNSKIVEYSSSLYSHEYEDSIPSYTFSLIE
tara:strand:- start:1135 stop:1434 length:300 start_codon:yes stop_codon:yes gene_type:complete